MKKVAFICIHNSCRSQMAEGWLSELGKGVAESYSAGTEKYSGPKPEAVEVMMDAGVDISMNTSKLLIDLPNEIDILITMGCGVECPTFPSNFREDWALKDPSGKSKYRFELTRDIVKLKVIELIQRIKDGEFDK